MSPTGFWPGVSAVKFRPARSGAGPGVPWVRPERFGFGWEGSRPAFAREAADRLQAGGDVPAVRLCVDAPVAVGAVGVLERLRDEQFQFLTPFGCRGFGTASPVVVAGFGDAESLAPVPDAVRVLRRVEPRLVDELVRARCRGSPAKYAAAFFRKVFSISASRIRRSSSLRRARSLSVSSASGAGSWRALCFFTQPRRVSGFIPGSRPASEIVLLELSATRTASSRNSGVYLLSDATSCSLVPCSGKPY
ncbi:hypothetical protein C9F11_43890 (plasmid) [Streptomyces sp. YIM 121038]|nr:hypothetical protein C9F11_43890 [Streptomyces sp. YIM 121038]